MKQNIKLVIILSILIALYIFICAYSYVSAMSNNLASSVFRLHIIANSDSKEDQNLKYLVRDDLIDYMNKICSKTMSKEDVINTVNQHINIFKEIAEDTVKKQGFSYPVNVEIGNFEFPTKTYGDISFPAGYYDALRIKIGESSGQNWWCVMFPPLCFVNPTTGIVSDESKDMLQENLSQEEYKIISDTEDKPIVFKFKLIEFFQESGLITAKNN